ncbi:MAG: radical SAM protein, partial [Treponema sp.]|nr:radical SAM protein [Treponema sp.]
SDPNIYKERVRPIFKEKAWPAMLAFARNAVRYVPSVTMTTVSTTITHEDEEKCLELCRKIGAKYRIRKMVD